VSIAADQLVLDRGGTRVLDGINAALVPGEITAIVGPNGAGKSSLLLAFAGLIAPLSGQVTLDDAPLATLDPVMRAKAIGYLPQGADIAWDVAVETLVALGRMPHRDDRAEPVNAALTALDLQSLRHRPISTLSGGERARVLLARVLAGEPRWILADEPLAALDLAHQLALAGHLRLCAHAGAGVVIVLHDLTLAMNHADRVLVLDRGTIAADGPPQAALSSEVIQQVWGVATEWLGQPGQHALVSRPQG
jgi:iron complex transport system ATP-binding protein